MPFFRRGSSKAKSSEDSIVQVDSQTSTASESQDITFTQKIILPVGMINPEGTTVIEIPPTLTECPIVVAKRKEGTPVNMTSNDQVSLDNNSSTVRERFHESSTNSRYFANFIRERRSPEVVSLLEVQGGGFYSEKVPGKTIDANTSIQRPNFKNKYVGGLTEEKQDQLAKDPLFNVLDSKTESDPYFTKIPLPQKFPNFYQFLPPNVTMQKPNRNSDSPSTPPPSFQHQFMATNPLSSAFGSRPTTPGPIPNSYPPQKTTLGFAQAGTSGLKGTHFASLAPKKVWGMAARYLKNPSTQPNFMDYMPSCMMEMDEIPKGGYAHLDMTEEEEKVYLQKDLEEYQKARRRLLTKTLNFARGSCSPVPGINLSMGRDGKFESITESSDGSRTVEKGLNLQLIEEEEFNRIHQDLSKFQEARRKLMSRTHDIMLSQGKKIGTEEIQTDSKPITPKKPNEKSKRSPPPSSPQSPNSGKWKPKETTSKMVGNEADSMASMEKLLTYTSTHNKLFDAFFLDEEEEANLQKTNSHRRISPKRSDSIKNLMKRKDDFHKSDLSNKDNFSNKDDLSNKYNFSNKDSSSSKEVYSKEIYINKDNYSSKDSESIKDNYSIKENFSAKNGGSFRGDFGPKGNTSISAKDKRSIKDNFTAKDDCSIKEDNYSLKDNYRMKEKHSSRERRRSKENYVIKEKYSIKDNYSTNGSNSIKVKYSNKDTNSVKGSYSAKDNESGKVGSSTKDNHSIRDSYSLKDSNSVKDNCSINESCSVNNYSAKDCDDRDCDIIDCEGRDCDDRDCNDKKYGDEGYSDKEYDDKDYSDKDYGDNHSSKYIASTSAKEYCSITENYSAKGCRSQDSSSSKDNHSVKNNSSSKGSYSNKDYEVKGISRTEQNIKENDSSNNSARDNYNVKDKSSIEDDSSAKDDSNIKDNYSIKENYRVNYSIKDNYNIKGDYNLNDKYKTKDNCRISHNCSSKDNYNINGNLSKRENSTNAIKGGSSVRDNDRGKDQSRGKDTCRANKTCKCKAGHSLKSNNARDNSNTKDSCNNKCTSNMKNSYKINDNFNNQEIVCKDANNKQVSGKETNSNIDGFNSDKSAKEALSNLKDSVNRKDHSNRKSRRNKIGSSIKPDSSTEDFSNKGYFGNDDFSNKDDLTNKEEFSNEAELTKKDDYSKLEEANKEVVRSSASYNSNNDPYYTKGDFSKSATDDYGIKNCNRRNELKCSKDKSDEESCSCSIKDKYSKYLQYLGNKEIEWNNSTNKEESRATQDYKNKEICNMKDIKDAYIKKNYFMHIDDIKKEWNIDSNKDEFIVRDGYNIKEDYNAKTDYSIKGDCSINERYNISYFHNKNDQNKEDDEEQFITKSFELQSTFDRNRTKTDKILPSKKFIQYQKRTDTPELPVSLADLLNNLNVKKDDKPKKTKTKHKKTDYEKFYKLQDPTKHKKRSPDHKHKAILQFLNENKHTKSGKFVEEATQSTPTKIEKSTGLRIQEVHQEPNLAPEQDKILDDIFRTTESSGSNSKAMKMKPLDETIEKMVQAVKQLENNSPKKKRRPSSKSGARQKEKFMMKNVP